jgi:hypothetical protein
MQNGFGAVDLNLKGGWDVGGVGGRNTYRNEKDRLQLFNPVACTSMHASGLNRGRPRLEFFL